VAAPEAELERIAADQGDVLEHEVIGRELGDLLQPTHRPVALAAALGAGTGPAQHAARIAGTVAALPLDAEELALAVEVDGDRKRVEPGVGLGRYRTLMTGSCRKDRIEV
jgi:hypothetical protein